MLYPGLAGPVCGNCMPNTISVALTPGVVAACAGRIDTARALAAKAATVVIIPRRVRDRDARFFTALALFFAPFLPTTCYQSREHSAHGGREHTYANRR